MAAPLVADENVAGQSGSILGEGSDTTSLMSSIKKYRQENGRTYHAYKDGSYVIPNDQRENDRLDFQHHMFYLTFDGKLHTAPLPTQMKHVLDAGCGTGIWATDFADEHPDCHVTGVDLSPIQPNYVPPNVGFFVDDLEDAWSFPHKFDFIYARGMTGGFGNWPKFFGQCFEFLNPGGVLEMVDIVYPLQCDDGTIPADSALLKWTNILLEGMAAFSRPIDSALKYREQLTALGYVDIVEQPYKWPQNHWPKDAKHKEIGIWNFENFSNGLTGFSLAMFTRPKDQGGLGWSVEEMEAFLAKVRADLANTSIHAYWPIHVVYAKKPE